MKTFKKGDRVAVYGGIPGTHIECEGLRGTIGKISTENWALVVFDEFLFCDDAWFVTLKKCRRLRKVRK